MARKFYWDEKSIAVEDAAKNEIETVIENILDYSESPDSAKIKPCHNEPAYVHVFQYNPLKNEAYGEIQCCCGDELTKFALNIDSKEISYY